MRWNGLKRSHKVRFQILNCRTTYNHVAVEPEHSLKTRGKKRAYFMYFKCKNNNNLIVE